MARTKSEMARAKADTQAARSPSKGEAATVSGVMGRYASDPDLASKPLFERWYANMWDNLTVNVREGRVPVTGTILSTGNASMRRDDFLAVGGFDLTLRQAEDSELGLKLEKSG